MRFLQNCKFLDGSIGGHKREENEAWDVVKSEGIWNLPIGFGEQLKNFYQSMKVIAFFKK